MLLAAAGLSARSVCVCGSACTAAGLTLSLNKGSASPSRQIGGFSLHAGALVLGDEGIVCVDEFDKMPASLHGSLHEAMEQQSISIAKGGIVCSVPARVGVIAAANPPGGYCKHLNDKLTLASVQIGPALLSRFDLIFIIQDTPNEQRDAEITSNLLKLRGMKRPNSQRQLKLTDLMVVKHSNGKSNMPIYSADDEPDLICSNKELDMTTGEILTHTALKNYIEFARKTIHPSLSQDSCEILADFYVDWRTRQHLSSNPVSIRQLQGLQR